jgi:carbon-monoxide dehydrogenase medium subunit
MQQYLNPATIEDACSLALKYQGQAKIIAGGTDLLPRLKQHRLLPAYLINIKGIGQDYILFDKKEGLRIGALTTIRSIAASPLIMTGFSLLAQAAGQLGSAQVREQATIAGNLCNASPSAETAPPLIALGSQATITGADGKRTILIENFFLGPGRTVLRPGEILTEIQVRNLPPRSGGVYLKHTLRKALDLAVVGVAVAVTLDGNILNDAKIALGAVAPTPIRARKAEELLRGKKISLELIQKAAKTASAESSPIDDIRSSADYRKKMIEVLVARAVSQAVEQVKP